GDGSKIRFWLDNWLLDEALKDIYPRLFMVSAQKEEVISAMGFLEENSWHWNLVWRRQLFQWEYDQVEDMLNLLEAVILSNDSNDKLCVDRRPGDSVGVERGGYSKG
ncbi:hypothetical protein A2U01_0047461, partial [Trifolium medium]|nr:hypothetical protein [Trifolium medium]